MNYKANLTLTSQPIVPIKTIDFLKNQFAITESFDYQSVVVETESKEYSGCRFQLGEKLILFRKAKITPTKIGQFVTLYKRNSNKIIAPFDFSDGIDYVVILVVNEDKMGQFVFSQTLLFGKGVFSTDSKEGKRAIRVYPPWDRTISKQAISTQKWQLDCFTELC